MLHTLSLVELLLLVLLAQDVLLLLLLQFCRVLLLLVLLALLARPAVYRVRCAPCALPAGNAHPRGGMPSPVLLLSLNDVAIVSSPKHYGYSTTLSAG
jgi:hypothetical protein